MSTNPATKPELDALGDAMPNPDGTHSPWRYVPIALIAAGLVGAYLAGVQDYLSLGGLVAARDGLASWIAEWPAVSLSVFVVVYVISVALSLPGALVLTISGGFLFGVVAGTVASSVGATIGAVLLFLAARTAIGESLRARAGPWLERLSDGFRENAFSYLLFLRLVPLFPFWLVNLAPAALGVPLKTYTLATLIGILPGSIAFTYLGAGLDSVIAAQAAAQPACAADPDCELQIEASALVTTELLVALGLLGLVSLIPIAVKRWRSR